MRVLLFCDVAVRRAVDVRDARRNDGVTRSSRERERDRRFGADAERRVTSRAIRTLKRERRVEDRRDCERTRAPVLNVRHVRRVRAGAGRPQRGTRFERAGGRPRGTAGVHRTAFGVRDHDVRPRIPVRTTHARSIIL